MHNIKIIKIEFRHRKQINFGDLYSYLLHRDDNGTPFNICVDHYMRGLKRRAEEIEHNLNDLQMSLEGNYGYISNLFDVINELKELDYSLDKDDY